MSCRTSHAGETLSLSKSNVVIFLNEETAGKAITTDREEKYFELVQPIEISLQMHKPVPELSTKRKEIIEDYRNFLRGEVTNFTVQERNRIAQVLKEVYRTCDKVCPGLFPPRIRLIKTLGRHYGDGVYYTREDCIVIPQNVLNGDIGDDFTQTMYHEVWHIISRYRPKLQRAAYELIGFFPQPTIPLKIPKRLQEHLLFNPDGVDMNWQIRFKSESMNGQVTTCVPILFTQDDTYTQSKPTFFNYIQFNLYPISGGRVITNADSLTSPIVLKNESAFFNRITDNTNYIIHPDELIADNFMFIMTTSTDIMKRQRFSKEGNTLLKELEQIIKTVR